MAKKGASDPSPSQFPVFHFPGSMEKTTHPRSKNANHPSNSEVAYRPYPPYLDGHDRLLPHDDQTPYPPAAQYAQVRPRREEEGAVPGSDQGWTSEINRGLRLRFPFTPVFAICDLYDGMALLGGEKSYC